MISNYFTKDHNELGDENLQSSIILCYSCLYHWKLGRPESYGRTLQNLLKSNNLPLIALAMKRYIFSIKHPSAALKSLFEYEKNDENEESFSYKLLKLYLLHEGSPPDDTTSSSLPSTDAMMTMDNTHQYMLVCYLLHVIEGIRNAALTHSIESEELTKVNQKFRCLITAIFENSSVNDARLMQYLLLPFQRMQYEKLQKKFEPNNWHIFYYENSLVRYCLEKKMTTLFEVPQVYHLISDVFWGSSRSEDYSPTVLNYSHYSIYAHSFLLLFDATKNNRRKEIYGENYSDLEIPGRQFFDQMKYTHALPSNPAFVMFLEFFSKAALLGLIGYVSIGYYGATFETDYSTDYTDTNMQDKISNLAQVEIALIAFGSAEILYQYGRLLDKKKFYVIKDKKYFHSLDVFFACVMKVWIGCRVSGAEFFPIARIILSLAAIPLSFRLLRYTCIYRPFGEIMHTIQSLSTSIFAFIFIYFSCIVGFGIFFCSLFYRITDGYSTFGFTLITLLQNTLLNFDTSSFLTSDESVNTLGIVVMVIFVVLTAIILMNLFIAQLSVAYKEKQLEGKQNWSYDYAKLTANYLSFKEHNILCMYPAPFNLIAIVLAPLYYLIALVYEVSIGTMISYFICSYLFGSWLRLYHNICHFKFMLSHQLSKSMHEKNLSIPMKFLFVLGYCVLSMVLIVLDFLFLPVYSLICEILFVKAELSTHITEPRINSSIIPPNTAGSPPAQAELRPLICSLYIHFVAREEFVIYIFFSQCAKLVTYCIHWLRGTLPVPPPENSLLKIKIPEFHLKLLKIVKKHPPRRYRLSADLSATVQVDQEDAKGFGDKRLFARDDIERILRPMKPHAKSLMNEELLQLEKNLAQETSHFTTYMEQTEDRINGLEVKLNILNANIVKLLVTLEKRSPLQAPIES